MKVMTINQVRQYLKIDEIRKTYLKDFKEGNNPLFLNFMTYDEFKKSHDKREKLINESPIELIKDTIRFLYNHKSYRLHNYTLINNETDAIIEFEKIYYKEDYEL